jgi:hypothetical protein
MGDDGFDDEYDGVNARDFALVGVAFGYWAGNFVDTNDMVIGVGSFDDIRCGAVSIFEGSVTNGECCVGL